MRHIHRSSWYLIAVLSLFIVGLTATPLSAAPKTETSLKQIRPAPMALRDVSRTAAPPTSLQQLHQYLDAYIHFERQRVIGAGQGLASIIRDMYPLVAATPAPAQTSSFLKNILSRLPLDFFSSGDKNTSTQNSVTIDAKRPEAELKTETAERPRVEESINDIKQRQLTEQLGAVIRQLFAQLPTDATITPDTDLKASLETLAWLQGARFYSELPAAGIGPFGEIQSEMFPEGDNGIDYALIRFLVAYHHGNIGAAWQANSDFHERFMKIRGSDIVRANSLHHAITLDLVQQLIESDRRILALHHLNGVLPLTVQLNDLAGAVSPQPNLEILRAKLSLFNPEMATDADMPLIRTLAETLGDKFSLDAQNYGIVLFDLSQDRLVKVELENPLDFIDKGLLNRIDADATCFLLQRSANNNLCPQSCASGGASGATARSNWDISQLGKLSGPQNNFFPSGAAPSRPQRSADLRAALDPSTATGGEGNCASGDGNSQAGFDAAGQCRGRRLSQGSKFSANQEEARLFQCTMEALGGTIPVEIFTAPLANNPYCQVKIASDDEDDPPPPPEVRAEQEETVREAAGDVQDRADDAEADAAGFGGEDTPLAQQVARVAADRYGVPRQRVPDNLEYKAISAISKAAYDMSHGNIRVHVGGDSGSDFGFQIRTNPDGTLEVWVDATTYRQGSAAIQRAVMSASIVIALDSLIDAEGGRSFDPTNTARTDRVLRDIYSRAGPMFSCGADSSHCGLSGCSYADVVHKRLTQCIEQPPGPINRDPCSSTGGTRAYCEENTGAFGIGAVCAPHLLYDLTQTMACSTVMCDGTTMLNNPLGITSSMTQLAACCSGGLAGGAGSPAGDPGSSLMDAFCRANPDRCGGASGEGGGSVPIEPINTKQLPEPEIESESPFFSPR